MQRLENSDVQMKQWEKETILNFTLFLQIVQPPKFQSYIL